MTLQNIVFGNGINSVTYEDEEIPKDEMLYIPIGTLNDIGIKGRPEIKIGTGNAAGTILGEPKNLQIKIERPDKPSGGSKQKKTRKNRRKSNRRR